MILNIIIFIISFLFLVKAGTMLVKSLTRLARFFQISEYILAFILMSFATTIPELFVGISSAIENIPKLSLGNIIGANFINITLVIGLVAFLSKGIKIESKISQKNFWLIFFIALLPIFLATDGIISQGDGLLLILTFVLYMTSLIREKEYFTKTIQEIEFNNHTIYGVFKMLGSFLLGIVVLIASSAVLVWSGKQLILEIGINALTFGIIFVALGTTLPELAFGIRASMLKHSSMSIGNAIGAVAFNSAFIIGLVSMISPIHINDGLSFFIAAAFLIAAMLLLNVFVYTRSNISRRESLILIFLYFFFLLTQY
ncbi:sodium:calcium antiporter, partial [Patescibacteria group bacterium]|nr:sodium:calcium antiporter [Patescibacteria group bacterium]